MNSPREVKARASKLRDVLSVMGHELKHSESLEVISKIEGYPDWNTYTAHIDNKQNIPHRYSIDPHSKSTNPPDHPIIDAMKFDNETLLRESLSDEVLDNQQIMTEVFYQSVVLERLSLAEVLISEGADIGSLEIRGLPLFEFVIHIERGDYLKMLIFKFKHLEGIHRKSSAILPLVVDLFKKGDDVMASVKCLLNQGANINARNQNGGTALIIAGYVLEDIELVTYLVENGADVNSANRNGDTALIDAAERGNIPILEYLLENGADLNHKNNEGHTALDHARYRKNSEAVEILVKRTELE